MPLNETQYASLLSSLRHLCTNYSDYELFIVGEFNMPDVSWISGVSMGILGSSNMSNEYLNVITDTGHVWYITDQVTRWRLVNRILQKSTLDQILLTNEVFVNYFKIVAPLGNSDHICINIELDVDMEKKDQIKSNIAFDIPLISIHLIRPQKRAWLKGDPRAVIISHNLKSIKFFSNNTICFHLQSLCN